SCAAVQLDRDYLRTSPDRQWQLLPIGTLASGLRRDQHDREEDASASATDERQGRALPPHPARGMGLHPTLDLRSATSARLPALHPLLQSPPTPRRARLGHTQQPPRGQPPRGAQLSNPCTAVTPVVTPLGWTSRSTQGGTMPT